MSDSLSIIPLGGLGEIGMNCMAYKYAGQIMLVDCGVTFPGVADHGVDLIIPSFEFLREQADSIAGVVLTHGHEDHIGALPFLLRDHEIPVYGPPLALELVRRRLEEHDLDRDGSLNEIAAGEEIDVGPFAVELIHVNHSIPHVLSLAIRTPVGLVVHTGDFKVDYHPVNEDPIDLARFAELGDEGVLCLLSDSTNVGVKGFTSSESRVASSLSELIERTTGRVLVTLFASNLHRIQSLLKIADEQRRKVVLLGRSLISNLEIGRRLGIIELPDPKIIIQPRDLDNYRHDQVLILTTGSQGEPRSALTRIAKNDHPLFEMRPGDCVIYSSRTIPGNELTVSRVVNNLYRRGAEVHRGRELGIHASGHACREEQKLMLQLTRPRFFVPTHGEYRHLAKHAKLADSMDVERAFILENGELLRLEEDSAEVTVGVVSAGRSIVEGCMVDDAPTLAYKDRRKLARTGLVIALLDLETESGQISNPRLLVQGIMTAGIEKELVAEASAAALLAVADLSIESRQVVAEVAEAVRLAVRRVFRKRIERKPVVVPIINYLANCCSDKQ